MEPVPLVERFLKWLLLYIEHLGLVYDELKQAHGLKNPWAWANKVTSYPTDAHCYAGNTSPEGCKSGRGRQCVLSGNDAWILPKISGSPEGGCSEEWILKERLCYQPGNQLGSRLSQDPGTVKGRGSLHPSTGPMPSLAPAAGTLEHLAWLSADSYATLLSLWPFSALTLWRSLSS